jgi:putative NADH-flavin reductase
VTGTTRGAANLAARQGLVVATVHPADAAALAGVLQGHDVVVVSLKWDVNDIDAVIEAIRISKVRRALIVVGAGSLLRADGRLHFHHMASPAPSSKPAMIALEKLREVDDFDWTAISPPTSIKPGERTGKYRLGTDTMVVDAADNGQISREDFAVAIMDDIENPKHVRRRFTVGY